MGPLVLSTDAMLLITLAITNLTSDLLDRVSQMSPSEVKNAIAAEQERKDELLAQLEGH